MCVEPEELYNCNTCSDFGLLRGGKKNDTWRFEVLAIAESELFTDYIGAKRGEREHHGVTTTGNWWWWAEEKRTEVSREQRYTEEVHRGQTGTGNQLVRGSSCNQSEVYGSVGCCTTWNKRRAKRGPDTFCRVDSVHLVQQRVSLLILTGVAVGLNSFKWSLFLKETNNVYLRGPYSAQHPPINAQSM